LDDPPSTDDAPVRAGASAGDDTALATAAAGGDRQALATLLDRHADRVHAICRRIVTHPEDALDATQEALIGLARGIASFDGRAAFTTWLYRIATNAALDELRRRSRRPIPHDAPAHMSTPSREGAVDARLDVDRALAEVPTEFRTAVVLRDLADLDYREIAAVLEVPVGTVKSRIARGRRALRDALGNQDPSWERQTGEP
jgi:RNA polymerase sigma-70 factor (ECF subfamily)